MKLLFACFLFSAFSFSLINTNAINHVLYGEIIKSIITLSENIEVGMQSLHSPRNIQESCCWSAFKCFINETLLLKPAHSQNEKLFNTTLSRIRSSQLNVRSLLYNSESDCVKNCMDYPKKPEAEFLEDFKLLLQMLNRHQCNKRSTP